MPQPIVDPNAPVSGGEGGIVGYFEDHPIMAVAAAAVGVFIIVLILTRKNQTPATSSSSPLAGLQSTDANGNPVLYLPTTGDEWITINKNSNNPVSTTTTTTTATAAPPTLPPGHPPPHPPPPPKPVPAPPPKTPPPPGKPPSTKGQWVCHYTVRGGDTLSAIAGRYNTTWMALYSHNQSIIDSMAASHHFPVSPHPYDNIFPGETILVPCTS